MNYPETSVILDRILPNREGFETGEVKILSFYFDSRMYPSKPKL